MIPMVTNPVKNVAPIGKGEAAALSLAKVYEGIIASNNIKDILYYVEQWELDYITTAEVLIEAKNMGLIDEYDGNIIWEDMLVKKRSLPANTFSEHIRSFGKNTGS